MTRQTLGFLRQRGDRIAEPAGTSARRPVSHSAGVIGRMGGPRSRRRRASSGEPANTPLTSSRSDHSAAWLAGDRHRYAPCDHPLDLVAVAR